MKNKNYHYLSALAGLIILLTQVFNYWTSVKYGTPFNISQVVAMCLVGISFMIPFPADMPKLPPAYVARLLLVLVALLLLGYSWSQV